MELPAEADDARSTRLLIQEVYRDLRAVAAQKLRGEPSSRSDSPTDFLHASYLRLERELGIQVTWANRRQFISVAAEKMAQILIERARKRKTVQSEGDDQQVELNDDTDFLKQFSSDDWLDVLSALHRLEAEQPTQAAIVKFRYLIGLTIPEIAELLGISVARADYQRRMGIARQRELLRP